MQLGARLDAKRTVLPIKFDADVVPPFRFFAFYLRRDQMRLLYIHRRALLRCVAGFGLLASMASAQGQSNLAKLTKSSACPNDDSALKLPPGFCATVFADGIGHARHLVVSAGGLVYVNTWSSPYYITAAPFRIQADS